MREQLFEIIDGVQKHCEADGTYCCDCEYQQYKDNTCWKYMMVDAIINSGVLIHFDKAYTCADCKHYIGAGDWNLCCRLKYGLCYESTPACTKFEEKENA